MRYDPIKRSLGSVFNRTPFLRISFYRLLDLLLLRSWHIRRELGNLQKEGFRPGQIADAGSGFGQYVHYLSRKYPAAKITGLDIKQEQVDDCNRFFSSLGKQETVSFEYADLTQLDRREEFDLVLSVDVMEHIEDDRGVMKHLYRGLKPGGILLISTPSDQGGSDVHHEHDESFIDEHVRDGYGVEEIDEKLRSAGFNEVHIRYSYGKPGKISWKLSMKYPILLANVSKLFLLLLPLYYLVVYPFCFILNIQDVRSDHSTGTGLIVKCKK
ncbi:MAG: class I SAM-dependent methyltransferase [Bacteroidales bacterium]|nr:class I SAM-dependent methyltransferase [Bacteroidales bacterium]